MARLSANSRARWLALLLGCLAGAWVTPARADCAPRSAHVVVPGTYQRVAPRNTHVFVASIDPKLLGAELRQKADQALVPSRATNRVDAENGNRNIELVPNALLQAGSAYEVHGVSTGGSLRLATFRVVDVVDDTPPRLGEVELTLSRSGGSLRFDALVDDTTSDDSLRLLLWQREQDPNKPAVPPLNFLPNRFADGRVTYFLEGRGAECNISWHSYGEAKVGALYTLAVVDQAGNVSSARTVKVGEQYPRSQETAKVSLYYVPAAGVLVQARTLLLGLAALLLAALALVVAWRSRRRRIA